MSSFVFMSLFPVSIVAPTLPAIASELHIAQSAVQQMVLSIYLLGFACGPLIASPLSETYGRVKVVRSWNLLYIIFNASYHFEIYVWAVWKRYIGCKLCHYEFRTSGLGTNDCLDWRWHFKRHVPTEGAR